MGYRGHSDDGYRAAIDQLLSLADFERKSRADQPPDWHRARVERLLQMLGDPHLAKPVVHVAGSKGKGSTAAFIASALTANGYRTGVYSSPHLHRFTERIAVDRVPIAEAQFAALIHDIWPLVEGIRAAGDIGEVSVFELLTAMAFVHFAEHADVDVAVIEVGLGGRLDATNVVRPVVSVITPISLDHVAVLGDTVSAIAWEKAGIIKPKTPVVMGRQSADAAEVIAKRAEELGAPQHDAIDETAMTEVTRPDGLRCVSFRAITSRKFGAIVYRQASLGEHQRDNARTAVAALQVLADAGFEMDADRIDSGLMATPLPCRTELIRWRDADCRLLVDGAHNDASARALAETIASAIPQRNRRAICVVLGATSGHDVGAVTNELERLAQPPAHVYVIATTSRHPKALAAEQVARAAANAGLEVRSSRDSVDAAMREAAALVAAGEVGLVVATGSLFVAAEARELALGIAPELYPDLPSGYMQPYDAASADGRRDLN